MGRLFLVRHGETVDNVAGVYAGVRDSPLTTHGVLQAKRLAAHLAKRSGEATMGPVTHVFASDLKRAVETAQAVVDALPVVGEGEGEAVQVVQDVDLRERNFGSAEGKKFGVADTADAETLEQMRARAARFVERQLAPAMRASGDGAVVVVAHGVILGSLLRVLMARFGDGEVPLGGKPVAWSNTGYVEAAVRVEDIPLADSVDGTDVTSTKARIRLTLIGTNAVTHLDGLKKTRGGIGSAQFDKRQRTMDSFFGPLAKKLRRDSSSTGTN